MNSICKKKNKIFKFILLFFAVGLLNTFILIASTKKKESESFNTFKIRVIRPKYQLKNNLFEFGTQGAFYLNRAFVESIKLSGYLAYHFNNYFGLELDYLYGNDLDTKTKKDLSKKFDIKTNVLKIKSYYGGHLVVSPIYGKFQVAQGGVLYLDSFFILGTSLAEIRYDYDNCLDQNQEKTRQPQNKTYPSVKLGIGQRLFLSPNLSLRWDLRDYYIFNISEVDGACNENIEEENVNSFNNISMQIGLSFFI